MPLAPNTLTNTESVENVDHHHGRIQVCVFNHEISLSYYSSAYTICSLPTHRSQVLSLRSQVQMLPPQKSARGVAVVQTNTMIQTK